MDGYCVWKRARKRMWTMAKTCGVTARWQGRRSSGRSDTAFWTVLDEDDSKLTLDLAPPESGRAIALFSSQEGVRMFCYLGDVSLAPRVEETSAREVVSLLYRQRPVAKYVTLDPPPQMLRSRLLSLLMLDRDRFARSFAGARLGMEAKTSD
jgi:hypothetical protein